MPTQQVRSRFDAELLRPANSAESAPWAFLLLPKNVSDTLPRRGRSTVAGTINGYSFQETLEPDGQLSHWLKVTKELEAAAGIAVGEIVTVELSPVEEEPEPEVPADLQEALADASDARRTWDSTTAIARLDWIHWIVSAKQPKTRMKRIRDACEMLAEGKKRVCCFDPSGYYSKAFKAPLPAEQQGG